MRGLGEPGSRSTLEVFDWGAYRTTVKRHYETVVEPDLRRGAGRDYLLFRITWYLSMAFALAVLVSTPDPLPVLGLKVVLGLSVWSFVFFVGHLNAHCQMWTARGTLDQPAFAFYHHYVDPLMYSRHRHKFRAVQIEGAALLVFPMIYIDNVVGSVLVFTGTADMLAHQWYHTRVAERRRDFGVLGFAAMACLERLKIIDTREHIRVHHGHGVAQQEDVHGWVDVRWPVVGRCCDALGERLYPLLRDTRLRAPALLAMMLGAYALTWILVGEHATRAASALALSVHVLTIAALIWMRIPASDAATDHVPARAGAPRQPRE